MNSTDRLKLENQLCFPLYVASKEIIRKYKPLLSKYDLTYTQYIVMMVLWEKKFINVKELGKYLYLDSGTLTPVLKKLEQKGYIKRDKSQKDERNLVVSISSQGELLKNKIKDIPQEMGKCLNLDEEETVILYKVLYKIIKNIDEIGE